MTTKTRDKWIPALLLAILVHIIIFVLIFINYTDRSTIGDSSAIEQSHPSSNPDLKTDTMKQQTMDVAVTEDKKERDSSEHKTAISETATVNSSDSKRSKSNLSPAVSDEQRSQPNLENATKALNEEAVNNTNSEKDALAANALTDSAASAFTSDNDKKIQGNFKQHSSTLQSGNEGDREMDAKETEANKSANPLTVPATNPALLAMDTPRQGINPKLNKRYNEVKSETEVLNTQLSSAISEVKKRNQQKIDQSRHQQSYAHAIDNVKASNTNSKMNSSNEASNETRLTQNKGSAIELTPNVISTE